eukprot:jgi/Botrbrau1/1538/Bobra.0107s0026.1
MGGHGGLNILPQKSWNVYGRENRLKVARDEAKHKEEEGLKREKHLQAERDHKRRLLLHRAAIRDNADGLPFPEPDRSVIPDATVLEDRATEARPGGHINFFEDFEAREMHPEIIDEKKNERRRRGNPETQTSDAKFDERFKFGFGQTGGAAKPWYSCPKEDLEQKEELHLLKLDPGGRPHSTAQLGRPQLLTGAQDDREKGQDRLDGRKSHKKDKKKERKKRKNTDKHVKGKKRGYEELRQEREQREAEERARATTVQLGRALEASEGYLDKRYHSAFGIVSNKRQRP